VSEQFACNVSDLKPGTLVQSYLTAADGREVPVAVARSEDGDFYAINDVCSHGEVSLSEGEMIGCEVECWAHGARFDVRTGAVTELPAIDPVDAYPLRVDGERVLVDVDNPLSASIKENA
jgi:3-phenylpropionate/trans-cinnamate dioxygenase ferredoxin subunit